MISVELHIVYIYAILDILITWVELASMHYGHHALQRPLLRTSTPRQEISSHTLDSSSGRLYTMVDKVGETMTAISANKERWTTPSHGTPSSPDCRRQLSSGKDGGRVQHFVPSRVKGVVKFRVRVSIMR